MTGELFVVLMVVGELFLALLFAVVLFTILRWVLRKLPPVACDECGGALAPGPAAYDVGLCETCIAEKARD